MKAKKFFKDIRHLKLALMVGAALVVGAAAAGCQAVPPLEPPTTTEVTTTVAADSGAATEATTEATTEKSEDVVKTGINPGQKAVDFELTTLDGTAHKLSDYAGKTVVVNFFASWCPPCQAEMPHFVETSEAYKDKDVVFLGVNLIESDTESDLEKFLENNKVTFPVVLDKGNKVAETYRIRAIPVTMVVSPNGVIYDNQPGTISKDKLVEWIEAAMLVK